MTERIRIDGVVRGEFVINTARIDSLFARAPALTFRHVRDAVGGMLGSFRREWLLRTQVDFSPRGGMKTERPNSRPSGGGTRFNRNRTFFYKVFPQSKTVPPGVEPKLEDIRAETFSFSEVALGLETGGNFRSKTSRYIAIPIGVTLDSLGRPKSKWASPSAYRKASPNNKLVAIQKRGRLPILYQVKRGKRAASQSGAFSRLSDRPQGRSRRAADVLLPAYQLVRSVSRRPRLLIMSTWDSLESDRDRRLSRAVDRILEDLDRGRKT